MPKPANLSLPFRRIYVDLPAKAAAKLDQLAKDSGLTKKAYLERLVVTATERAARREASGD